MAKQEEIREDAIVITKNQLWTEGIRDEQRLAVRAIQIVDKILHRLNDKGAVIKVERELPDNEAWHKVEREFEAFCAGRNIMVGAGCGFFEPLIKEE